MRNYIKGGCSSISVNGRTLVVKGDKVFVDGVRYVPSEGDIVEPAGPSPDSSPKIVELDSDGRFVGDIYGDVEIRVMGSGSITVVVEGKIGGSLSADGSVRCGKVQGNANAGGDIHCEKINGNANSGGDLRVAGKIGGNAMSGRDMYRG